MTPNDAWRNCENLTPTEAEKALAGELKTALAMVDVRTLDHFVIAGLRYTSFLERGWLAESPAESTPEPAKRAHPRKAAKQAAKK